MCVSEKSRRGSECVSIPISTWVATGESSWCSKLGVQVYWLPYKEALHLHTGWERLPAPPYAPEDPLAAAAAAGVPKGTEVLTTPATVFMHLFLLCCCYCWYFCCCCCPASLSQQTLFLSLQPMILQTLKSAPTVVVVCVLTAVCIVSTSTRTAVSLTAALNDKAHVISVHSTVIINVVTLVKVSATSLSTLTRKSADKPTGKPRCVSVKKYKLVGKKTF